jgi:hypothetical protein
MNKLAFLEGYMEKASDAKAEWMGALMDIFKAKQFKKGVGALGEANDQISLDNMVNIKNIAKKLGRNQEELRASYKGTNVGKVDNNRYSYEHMFGNGESSKGTVSRDLLSPELRKLLRDTKGQGGAVIAPKGGLLDKEQIGNKGFGALKDMGVGGLKTTAAYGTPLVLGNMLYNNLTQ